MDLQNTANSQPAIMTMSVAAWRTWQEMQGPQAVAAKAVANAVSLQAALGEPITGDYPRAFVERYPQVRDLVHTHVPDLLRATNSVGSVAAGRHRP